MSGVNQGLTLSQEYFKSPCYQAIAATGAGYAVGEKLYKIVGVLNGDFAAAPTVIWWNEDTCAFVDDADVVEADLTECPSESVVVIENEFCAVVDGAEYTKHDCLKQVMVFSSAADIDGQTPDVTEWINVSTGAWMAAAPAVADIRAKGCPVPQLAGLTSGPGGFVLGTDNTGDLTSIAVTALSNDVTIDMGNGPVPLPLGCTVSYCADELCNTTFTVAGTNAKVGWQELK